MRSPRVWTFGAIVFALAIAVLLSPWASPWPDGLERVAHNLGFSDRAAARPPLVAPLPDYSVPALGSGRGSTAAAGAAGTLLVLGLAWGWGRLLSAARSRTGERGSGRAGERAKGRARE